MSTAVSWCRPDKISESETCGICLEPLQSDSVVTECQHLFCHACVYTLFSYGDVQAPCPCCRKPISPYSVVDLARNEPLLRASACSPFGHTFVQLGLPGLASYHLISPENCYISYENAPANWTMDDGSAMPTTKQLQDVSFDKTTRQLTAR